MQHKKDELLKYSFKYLNECNMCGSDRSFHKILGKRLNTSQGKNPRNKIGITTTVLKCQKCNLIFSNPQPIPNSINDHYGIPPESYWSENYFQVNEEYFQGEVKIIKELLAFQKGMKSLDIGAGIGKAMKVLEKEGFDTYGFEPSTEFYDRAISRMGVKREKLKIGQIEDVDYDENTFDFVSFGAVLEHLYDPSESIKKAVKWLKPGGIIYIQVPSSNWLTSKIMNAYFKVIGSDYVSNISPMHEPFHLYEFSIKSFQEHAKVNGYEIAKEQYFVCETFLPRLFDPIVKPIMKKTNTGMQLSVWLRKK